MDVFNLTEDQKFHQAYLRATEIIAAVELRVLAASSQKALHAHAMKNIREIFENTIKSAKVKRDDLLSRIKQTKADFANAPDFLARGLKRIWFFNKIDQIGIDYIRKIWRDSAIDTSEIEAELTKILTEIHAEIEAALKL